MTVTLIFLYLALLVGIGLASLRFARGTGEDFFLASRSLGPVLLLLSLVATHMTSFSILGASGEAYHRGIGIFALMASSSALVVPALFLYVGPRLWALGKANGYQTQAELFRDRWGSNGLALGLFGALAVLLVPYLLISVKGAGLTFEQASGGRISAAVGGYLVGAAVVLYVGSGGMRGTAWVNAFQTAIFLVLGAVTFGLVVAGEGGLPKAMARVAASEPQLLAREGLIPLAELASYLVIPLSAAMFPHLSAQWLTARSAAAFRPAVVFYPLCVTVVWLPSVLLGVIGHAAVPGLAGPASGNVVAKLVELHASPMVGAVLTAGLFAAVMASLDSQALALGTMFTRDLVRFHAFGGQMTEARQVAAGRVFVALLVALACALAPLVDRSLFRLGVICFSGFVGLFPILVAALFWRRATREGAWAALATTAALWAYFAQRMLASPGYSVGGTGLLPAVVILAASSAALLLGSWASAPPERARLERFFPPRAAGGGG